MKDKGNIIGIRREQFTEMTSDLPTSSETFVLKPTLMVDVSVFSESRRLPDKHTRQRTCTRHPMDTRSRSIPVYGHSSEFRSEGRCLPISVSRLCVP